MCSRKDTLYYFYLIEGEILLKQKIVRPTSTATIDILWCCWQPLQTDPNATPPSKIRSPPTIITSFPSFLFYIEHVLMVKKYTWFKLNTCFFFLSKKLLNIRITLYGLISTSRLGYTDCPTNMQSVWLSQFIKNHFK